MNVFIPLKIYCIFIVCDKFSNLILSNLKINLCRLSLKNNLLCG